jgi:hypothetical protein
MGASYSKQKSAKAGKLDIGRFTALPHTVIHSVQFRGLGYAARALLFDLAAQYNQSNNGKLVCCMKYLQPLGWTSNDTINRALRELKASGLLIQTRQGMMPPMSRAAWFAIGWFGLDVTNDLDIEPKQYQRCQLTLFKPVIKINALTPINGVVRQTTGPNIGVAELPLAPIGGAVEVKNDPSPTPINGEFIDLPYTYPIIEQHYLSEVTQ